MAGQPGSPRGIKQEKQVAARAAPELVEDGMTIGLGTVLVRRGESVDRTDLEHSSPSS